MSFDLKQLSEPFEPTDIEWRPSRSGVGRNGQPYCCVLAYVTARAIANRLDAVCGPQNWCNTRSSLVEVRPGKVGVEVGISILIGDTWITKYDVAEPTNIEPVKGAFSGAMKRAGAQWGIARYLYLLDEIYAKCSFEDKGKGWIRAVTSRKDGARGVDFYWQIPELPSWAIPETSRDKKPVTKEDINAMKIAWAKVFAPEESSRKVLYTRFKEFLFSIFGEFPVDEPSCWTQSMVTEFKKRLEVSPATGPQVPFN